ncbi:MAG: glycosyltransferase [Bacteroidales bacterium]
MKNEVPVVSALMITYNHEPFIAQAIEGVLMQETNFKVELVIGEDCSTDGTRQICETYAAQYPDQIRLLPSEKNLGMMPNFIRTLQACEGKYIALCEGDDYWTDPLKLQKQVDFLEVNDRYVAVFHNSEYFDTINGVKRNYHDWYDNKDISPEQMILGGGYIYPTASLLFRKPITENYPDFLLNAKAGDRAISLFLITKGRFYYIAEKMSVYRFHQGGVSFSDTVSPDSHSKRVQSNMDLLKEFDLFSNGVYNGVVKNAKISMILSLLASRPVNLFRDYKWLKTLPLRDALYVLRKYSYCWSC